MTYTNDVRHRLLILLISNLFFVIAAIFFFSKSDYPYIIQERLGIKERITQNNVSQTSWNKSIEQLNYDSDIVFFGDSLTIRTDFQAAYPDYKIFNFGCAGDNLTEMKSRTYVIKSLSPNKIFFLGGINSLSNCRIDKAINMYRSIVDELLADNPNAEIYVQSVLPVKDDRHLNDKIVEMNTLIKSLADEYDITYINLYPLFENDGIMKDEYTTDGTHLSEEGISVWLDALQPYVTLQ